MLKLPKKYRDEISNVIERAYLQGAVDAYADARASLDQNKPTKRRKARRRSRKRKVKA